jgi:hypothetical protein
MAKRGWTIWAKDDARIRMFSIVESDRMKALKFLKTKISAHCVLISDQELSANLVGMLDIQSGTIMEWVPLTLG